MKKFGKRASADVTYKGIRRNQFDIISTLSDQFMSNKNKEKQTDSFVYTDGINEFEEPPISSHKIPQFSGNKVNKRFDTINIK